jgi:hypothetical protein
MYFRELHAPDYTLEINWPTARFPDCEHPPVPHRTLGPKGQLEGLREDSWALRE